MPRAPPGQPRRARPSPAPHSPAGPDDGVADLVEEPPLLRPRRPRHGPFVELAEPRPRTPGSPLLRRYLQADARVEAAVSHRQPPSASMFRAWPFGLVVDQ